MYNVPDNTFFCYDAEKEETFYVGNIDDLILLISKGYELADNWCQLYVQNKYFPESSMVERPIKSKYEIYDSHGRPIELDWEIQTAAREKFTRDNGFVPEDLKWKSVQKYRKKNKTYRGEFRKEPVEGIHKNSYFLPYIKSKRYKHLVSERLNPETKKFCRGSLDFWDIGYTYRNYDRSWKRQNKRRHQWKDK
ncbi:MAG: hypothetical protein [Caudoviricetes sp.]|nr:MAG: hypothetical protein [Caudoviricetes sp.]